VLPRAKFNDDEKLYFAYIEDLETDQTIGMDEKKRDEIIPLPYDLQSAAECFVICVYFLFVNRLSTSMRPTN
jgi:hypothetical protein